MVVNIVCKSCGKTTFELVFYSPLGMSLRCKGCGKMSSRMPAPTVIFNTQKSQKGEVLSVDITNKDLLNEISTLRMEVEKMDERIRKMEVN